MLSVKDETINKIGKDAMLSWILKFNKSFTYPNIKQLGALKEAYSKYGHYLRHDYVKWFDSLIKHIEKIS
jgi:hypothetical protein